MRSPSGSAAGGGIINAAEINLLITEYWADRPYVVGTASAWLDFSVDEPTVPASSEHILQRSPPGPVSTRLARADRRLADWHGAG